MRSEDSENAPGVLGAPLQPEANADESRSAATSHVAALAGLTRRAVHKPTGRSCIVGQPVCHVEIIGSDPVNLRRYYGDLFGWEFDTGDATTERVSEPGQYGFMDAQMAGVNGGIGGGAEFSPRVLFYVAVPDVEAALAAAERLGGQRCFGPEGTAGSLVIGQLTDPEGNRIGVAGTA